MTTHTTTPALSGEELDLDVLQSLALHFKTLRIFTQGDFADARRFAAGAEKLIAQARAARQALPVDALVRADGDVIDYGTPAALAQAAPADLTDERKGWEAAAKAISERAAGHYRNKSYDLQDECLQCASMLHDLKPARAAVVAIPAPAGYVLVPVEPTDAMVLAPGAIGTKGNVARIHRNIWAAMIAAAPAAQAQPAGAPTVSLVEAARAFVQYAEDCDEDCIQLDNLKAALAAAAQPAGAGAPSNAQRIRDILGICDAYESGIGHGLQRDGHKSGAIFGNPEHGKAYEIGYEEGESRATAPAHAGVAQAARDVLDERQRQVDVEGWTPAHDDEHAQGQMAQAAACYAAQGDRQFPENWPWSMTWWKPQGVRRNLVKAGALVLAEIERLDRAAIQASSNTGSDHA